MSVTFDFDGDIYTLPEPQATLLGENLRNYALGTFSGDVQEVIARGGATPDWLAGAMPLADAIEETLVGSRTGSVTLDGRAADAAYAALALIVHHGDSPGAPPGPCALLEALRKRIHT